MFIFIIYNDLNRVLLTFTGTPCFILVPIMLFYMYIQIPRHRASFDLCVHCLKILQSSVPSFKETRCIYF